MNYYLYFRTYNNQPKLLIIANDNSGWNYSFAILLFEGIYINLIRVSSKMSIN